jgi:hypothetical protein
VTLTEFLLARIGEDEDDARAAVDDDPNWLHLGDGRIIQGDAGFSVSSGWLELPHRYEAGDHITRHDPARVLAECEAKRRIVELAFSHAAKIDGEWGCCHSVQGIRDGLCDEQRPDDLPLLRLLALPYADHPDYRDEWKP